MKQLVLLCVLAGCGAERAPDRGELTAAAGVVRGGDYVVHFQMGHWSAQGPFSGGKYTGVGGATIKQ